ncbi:hypothetical protein [Blattabacterium cuenoti]|uniref:hypothetical protein n=1 Tax=Blattabacterium cuenoti TaxID=1653831 RepID=UPI001EE9F25C|nr:hypothetical protein [Blattabacterium cuenoti]
MKLNNGGLIFCKEKSKKDLENMTKENLHDLLNHAVFNEYYELAERVKKELDRR